AFLTLGAGLPVDLRPPLVARASGAGVALLLRRVGAGYDSVVAGAVRQTRLFVRVPLLLVPGLVDAVVNADQHHVDGERGDDLLLAADHHAEAGLLQADLVQAAAAGAHGSGCVHRANLVRRQPGVSQKAGGLHVLEGYNVAHVVRLLLCQFLRTRITRSKEALTPGGVLPPLASMNSRRTVLLTRDCSSSGCPVWRMKSIKAPLSPMPARSSVWKWTRPALVLTESTPKRLR